MTVRVTASAPGKIVLSGEYAVLDGAPAIGMAIDRRAVATVTDIDSDVNRVLASGYSAVEGLFKATANGLEWSQGEQEYRLVDAAWRSTGKPPVGSKLIELDSDDFIDAATQQKTGVGSSAALTVALCAALDQRNDIASNARRAHADLQDGAGSGIDIACSNRGGLIEYQMAGARSTTLRWPEGLVFEVIWTGVAASTAAKLALLKSRVSKPTRVRLVGAAEQMAATWRGGDANAIIAGCQDYNQALRSFGDDYDLGIFDAGHGELSNAAASFGMAYKPCGAGGGDIGIVLATDAESLRSFVGELPRGYTPLTCAMDNCGVRTDATRITDE